MLSDDGLSWVFYRFVVEQLALDKHVRYILTTYPVVIWALSGNLDKNYNPESPDQNGILIGKMFVQFERLQSMGRRLQSFSFLK